MNEPTAHFLEKIVGNSDCKDSVFSKIERSIASLQKLLSDKDKIMSGDLPPPFLGLCHEAGLDALQPWANEIFKQWPKFSGSVNYPVYSPNITYCKSYATQYRLLPLYKGVYGELRFELAEFVLERLKVDFESLKGVL